MHHSTPSAPTVGDALAAFETRFRDLVAAGVRSEATLGMHREHIRFLTDHLDVRAPLASVGAEVLESLARVEAQGRRGRRISGGTLRKRLCTLRGALALARRRGWLERVPEFPDVPYRYRPTVAHLRSRDELDRLCAALPLERAEWVYVAVFTGQHPADVNRMRAYLDADPFAEVPWALVRNTKNRDPIGGKTVMAEPLACVLRARFERERLAPGAPVVVPWAKDERCRMLRAASERLGLMRIQARALRHTTASWAAEELGTITPGLQHFLRHRSLEMAQRVYVHALRPAGEDIARALSAAWRRKPPKRSAVGNGAHQRNAPDGEQNTGGGSGPTSEARQRHAGRMGSSSTGGGAG